MFYSGGDIGSSGNPFGAHSLQPPSANLRHRVPTKQGHCVDGGIGPQQRRTRNKVASKHCEMLNPAKPPLLNQARHAPDVTPKVYVCVCYAEGKRF